MKSISYQIARVLDFPIAARSPVLTALILWLTARRFYKGRLATNGARKRKRLVFIPKTLFTDDLINVIEAKDPEFELWYISRQPLIRLTNVYLPPQLTEYDYRSSDEFISTRKEELRAHWEKTLRILKVLLKPAAFLSCAYYYKQEREFAAACLANGIPFVAAHKECITSPVSRVARAEVYGKRSGRFTGSVITTYNEDEKATIVDVGCADAAVVEVVGCPRMDPAFRRTPSATFDRKIDVVFFSFSRAAYLPVFRKVPLWPRTVDNVRIEPWDWSELYERYHRFAIRFARAHPDLRIALKVKTGFNVSDVLEQEVNGKRSMPKNLRVIMSGAGGSLAAAANVISAFNSTVLLEAIAARTPVIVPAFAEAQLGSIPERFGTLRLGEAVEYAVGEDEFEQKLATKARQVPRRNRELNHSEREALERYIGFVDGKAGERMRTRIVKVVKELSGAM
jgi:hypothetical protein